MAETIFKSPGVSTTEIDLSGPTPTSPEGTPAGVIGTSLKGRAFVPITVPNFSSFVAEFGNTDGEKFGPLAMYEWMQNAKAGTYVKMLGVGDAKKRTSSGANAGKVTNAGFVVGSQQVQMNKNGDGALGHNAYVNGTTSYSNAGVLGRTYLLGCFMSQSNAARTGAEDGRGYFDAAGWTHGSDIEDVRASASGSHPVLRGVLMAPSGVLLALSSAHVTNNTPSTTRSAIGGHGASKDAGSFYGSVNKAANAKDNFVLLLNGFSGQSAITASFDPSSDIYIAKKLNTNPAKIEEKGHLLYADYPVHTAHAVVTGTGLIAENHPMTRVVGFPGASSEIFEELAFVVSSSLDRNVGTANHTTGSGVPNFESFEDRFSTAFSPYVISQKFGGKPQNLFKIHALDDGAYANKLFKITIQNIAKSSDPKSDYGTFDLIVRDYNDTDGTKAAFETWSKLSLNPSSERYIARIIGDMHFHYDFDKDEGSQKLVMDGTYPNASTYIRVEVDTSVERGTMDATALPVGFRGPWHLVTSGSEIVEDYNTYATWDSDSRAHGTFGAFDVDAKGLHMGMTKDILRRVKQPPVPFRRGLWKGNGNNRTVDSNLCWGVQFTQDTDPREPNANQKVETGIDSLTKYFPMYHTVAQNVMVGANEGTPDLGGTILDADRFNNNIFSLERVQVITGTADTPDANQWPVAEYRRDGVKSATLTDKDGNSSTKTRFLDVAKDFASTSARSYLKYSFFVQGGFDGVNEFDLDKSKMLNAAIKREIDDSSQGGTSGPTVAAYRKAIDVMAERADVDIKLLAIPGARHTAVTDYAIDAVEDRFDAMYIMDIEEKDKFSSVVTSSIDKEVNVTNTAQMLQSRNLDTSFAAAYFPDVIMQDPETATNVTVPPSVAVLGAFALNDKVAHPWFAPAGFTRGTLNRVIEAQTMVNKTNMDELYEVDINPLAAFPHTPGVVVFGQKTMLARQSALDRVNVRRLLIEIRRRVRQIGNGILFEPNREETLAKFSGLVSPVLATIQQQQGLDRFKVQIDTTTTTQADVENNTIRGKIFLQPTRAVEFISLDFVITNQGTEV